MTRVWCPKWPDGCKVCRTKTRKHHGQGYCTRCYRRQQTSGALQPAYNVALRRERAGQLQHFCFACKTWKSETEFMESRRRFRTRCSSCNNAVRRAMYNVHRDEIRAKRRERDQSITEAIRAADRKRKTRGDGWRNNSIVPVETVQRWLDVAFKLHGGGDEPHSHHGWERVATVTGVSSRRIRALRLGQVQRTSVDTADRIARAIDAMHEFNEIVKPGVEGWSKHADFCTRCGRYDVPHHAKGLCRRCYCIVWWHQKHHNAPPPLVIGERWSMWYESCVMCKKTTHRHQARGVCAKCYKRERRKR